MTRSPLAAALFLAASCLPASDGYVFPTKNVAIKNFAIDTVHGDTLTRLLIETRFLVLQNDPAVPGAKKWIGMSYKWRRDQGDA